MDIVIIKQPVLPPRPKVRGSQHLGEKNGGLFPHFFYVCFKRMSENGSKEKSENSGYNI